MKKFQTLGRTLSKDEQKKIKGGLTDPGGEWCKALWTPCSFQQPSGATFNGVCNGFCWCIAQEVSHKGAECMEF